MRKEVTNNKSKEIRQTIQETTFAGPHWLIRWGMSIILLILILSMGILWAIPYPKIITLSLKIESEVRPCPIVSRASGSIIKIFCKNGDFVAKGDRLAYIESSANHDKVLMLLDELKEFRNQIYSGIYKNQGGFKLTNSNNLGELQSSYNSLYRKYLHCTLNTSIDTTSTLLLTEHYQTHKTKSNLDKYRRISFVETLNNEILLFENWKSKYILEATESGFLEKAEETNLNSYVNKNEIYYYINPSIYNLFGKMSVPKLMISKLKNGQDVQIRIKSIPMNKSEIIKGKILALSSFPSSDSTYDSIVDLDISNSKIGKEIRLKPGLTADVEINLENQPLLKRIMEGILKRNSN